MAIGYKISDKKNYFSWNESAGLSKTLYQK